MSQWPSAMQQSAKRAGTQVLDQLLLLVRLGMPDAELRKSLLSLLGEVDAKRSLAAAISGERNLSEDQAHWLQTGAARRTLMTQSAVEETAIATIDAELASSLREINQIEASLTILMPELKGLAEFQSPALASNLSHLEERLTRLLSAVKNVAQKRNLELAGTPGSVVEFSPLEHLPDENTVGARTVRVINHVVIRKTEGKSMAVILKGDVTAA